MKHIHKRFFSIGAAAVLAFSSMPLNVPLSSLCSVFAESAEEASGICGENAAWTYDGSGTLTISGTGAISDFQTTSGSTGLFSNVPWMKLYGDSEIRSVIIEPGITRIGDDTFSYHAQLTSVSIPDSVTSIGNLAFSGCNALQSVVLPDSVSSIGNMAFEYCKQLSEIVIPEAAEIGDYVFNGTAWLKQKQKEDPLVIVNHALIDGNTAKGDVIIPEGVTEIKADAFSSNLELTSIHMPDSLIRIGAGAFRGRALKEVVIPDGVTEIEKSTFESCKLQSVTLPANLKSIGDYAFMGSALEEVVIPEGTVHIGERAFRDCTKLDRIVFPDSISEIGNEAFILTGWLLKQREETPLVIVNHIVIDGIAETGTVIIPDHVTDICESAFGVTQTDGNRKPLEQCMAERIILPEGITEIPYNAFSQCPLLKEIQIPDTVTKIGKYAFEKCESLSDLRLPSNLNIIDSSAFTGCSSLTEVQLPDSVTRINSSAFSSCKNLTLSVSEQSQLDFIDLFAMKGTAWQDQINENGQFGIINGILVDSLYACSEDGQILFIPDGVRKIAAGGAMTARDPSAIVLPASVEQVAAESFGILYIGSLVTAKGLNGIYFGNPDCKIDEELYQRISQSVVLYGFAGSTAQIYAQKYGIPFEVIDQLPQQPIEEQLPQAPQDAEWVPWDCGASTFFDAESGILFVRAYHQTWEDRRRQEERDYTEGVKEAIIQDGVTGLGLNSLTYCENLEKVYLPESVTVIGWSAFLKCRSLKSITLPPTLTEIGNYAFDECDALTGITIPESVAVIGEGAFELCPNLHDIYILNPDCQIDSRETTLNSSEITVIHGIAGSAVQKYAGEHGFRFEAITENAETTPPDTTVTTTGTTTAPATDVQSDNPLADDINGDGDVSVADAVMLARLIGEDSTLTPQQTGGILIAGLDQNHDALITLLDVHVLLKKLLTTS